MGTDAHNLLQSQHSEKGEMSQLGGGLFNVERRLGRGCGEGRSGASCWPVSIPGDLAEGSRPGGCPEGGSREGPLPHFPLSPPGHSHPCELRITSPCNRTSASPHPRPQPPTPSSHTPGTVPLGPDCPSLHPLRKLELCPRKADIHLLRTEIKGRRGSGGGLERPPPQSFAKSLGQGWPARPGAPVSLPARAPSARFHKLEKWRRPFYRVLQLYENRVGCCARAFYNTRNTTCPSAPARAGRSQSPQAVYYFHRSTWSTCRATGSASGARWAHQHRPHPDHGGAELCEEVHLFASGPSP